MVDNSNTDSTYRDFIQKAVAVGEVWGLEGDEGLAISSSGDQDNRDVIPFWSEESLAKAVAVADWKDFQPHAVPLGEFMERWLVRMHNDEMLAGTDWNAELSGSEEEPLILALHMAREIESTGKIIQFVNYRDLNEFVHQVYEASGLGPNDI